MRIIKKTILDLKNVIIKIKVQKNKEECNFVENDLTKNKNILFLAKLK